MPKMKLDLDKLAVETFAVAPKEVEDLAVRYDTLDCDSRPALLCWSLRCA